MHFTETGLDPKKSVLKKKIITHFNDLLQIKIL